MSVYHNRTREGDLADPPEELAGAVLAGSRPLDGIGFSINATHFGGLTLAGDAALTLAGSLTTDKPPKGRVFLGNRRAESIALHRKGRNKRQGSRWHRIIEAVRDTRDVLGGMDCIADATIGFNATVVSPNEVTAQLAMVGDSACGLGGGVVMAILPGQGLAMVAGSAMTAAGSEIFAGRLALVGDATLRMRGTGGTSASVDPDQRRGGIVAIGIRGGHS